MVLSTNNGEKRGGPAPTASQKGMKNQLVNSSSGVKVNSGESIKNNNMRSMSLSKRLAMAGAAP